MSSYFWYEKKKVDNENEKYNNSTTNDYTDDNDSLIDKSSNELKLVKILNFKGNHISLELPKIKQLPTIIFVIVSLMLIILIIQFIQKLEPFMMTSNLYSERLAIKYIPELIGNQSIIIKAFIIASQFILLLIIMFLSSMIKQRISVPELKQETWRNYLVIIFSNSSIFSLIGLILFNRQTLNFSHHYLKISDNFLFSLFIISSFLFSYMTYTLLSKLHIKEMPKDCSYLIFKKYLILLMAVQIFCYIFSILLISFYKPAIEIERVLLSFIIFCSSINSTVFLLCYALFIFSLKYDLYYVNMNLQIRPDIEYFLNLDDSNLQFQKYN